MREWNDWDKWTFRENVYETIKARPEWADEAAHAIYVALRDNMEQLRKNQLDWEIVAKMALQKRLMNGNEQFLADKLEKLQPKAYQNWSKEWATLSKMAEKKGLKDGI